ncbi:restriction endonuclease subunit S [Diaphorobacter sp.]|uniref:restriction endonuclease subunit S n=1 Tax=Diaphorobacter sp. TaxID=1934310 RepID=UPI0028AC4644|nr:restriction endonuclease subunit S [Diaphorobacter sp.]
MTTKLLSELSTNISSGLTPLRSNPEFWDNGTIPWLKTEQLGEKYIYETNEHISKAALDKTSIKLFPENSLSIAMYGEGKTRGNISILKKAMATNQACCNVAIDPDKADFEYVYYFLRTQYDELRNLSSGVRKNLNSNDIKNYPIRLPENLDGQKKIANVLKALDAKIELNNRINAELEAMAKTLYDYWFVQFDFPDANGKPYKTSGGKMVYNPTLKREVPEGWSDVSLVDIATFTNGIACQKYYPSDGEETYRVIKIREFSSGFDENSESVRQSVPEKVIVHDGDILFSWSATLEVKLWTGGIGALNQHIFKVTSKNYPKTFYYFEILKYLEYFKMVAELRKTTMGHITKDHLVSSRIGLPPKNLIQEMDAKLSPAIKSVVGNSQQNLRLAKLRDWLLPMLMNGQVTAI